MPRLEPNARGGAACRPPGAESSRSKKAEAEQRQRHQQVGASMHAARAFRTLLAFGILARKYMTTQLRKQ
eukprot:12139968-Heterocapsa_arctica.AAC.1